MTTAIAERSQTASLPSLPEHGLQLTSGLTVSSTVAEVGWGRLPTAADRPRLARLLGILEARSRVVTRTDIIMPLTRLANHFRNERSVAEWQMLFEDYCLDLGEFSVGDIQQAIIDHRRTKPFFPKISELVELAQGHKSEREFSLKRVRQLL